MPEATPQPTDKGHAELQQPVADGAGVHNVGGNDEERYGQKDETLIEAVHEDFADDSNILSAHAQIDKRRQENGIGNRHTDACQDKKRQQTECKFRSQRLSASSVVSSIICS